MYSLIYSEKIEWRVNDRLEQLKTLQRYTHDVSTSSRQRK